MRLVKKKYLELDPKFKKQVVALTVRPIFRVLKALGKKEKLTDSEILTRLKLADRDNLFVILCVDKNMILGWALVDVDRKDVNIYVRKSFRRKGIGQKIMAGVHHHFGKLRCHRCNELSSAFFKSVNEYVK